MSFLLPPLGKNSENMHSSKMVETAKPISRSLYTDETHRGEERKEIFTQTGFFATAINTVFTDEGMQFASRGQQTEREVPRV